MASASRDTDATPAAITLPPLCVDLDGSLIHTDLLVESSLALLAGNPLMLFALPFWLLRGGKAGLKREISQRVELNPATLPYNQELVIWVREQRTLRAVALCTASDVRLAKCVADHLDIFDTVIASDGTRNLSGTNKAQALVERYGEHGFDYAGNAPVDLHVWRHAHAAIVVETGSRLTRSVPQVAPVVRTFKAPKSSFRSWAKALRLHQWIKNVLVFLPILAAHRVLDAGALVTSVVAFLCFGLCASSVYITNDLLDLGSDRLHHRKRHRPFAAGTIPLYQGPLAAAALLLTAFTIALLVSPAFVTVLSGYYILTTAYSFKLKRVVMLDVVVLAMLYTTRILAGAAAIHSVASFWLLAFSMFIFLSLAMVKRYVELLTAQKAGKVKASGRGYDVEDVSLIQSLGSSSGYLAVLVLALYIDSTASSALYRHPHYLWMLCPLLLYWISRIWAIAHRGIMHDDPVVFAVMDKTSRILLVLAGIIVVASI